MSVIAYGCKRRIFDALGMEDAPGRVLDGVQVSYDWPAEQAKALCIYGGGVRETQTDDASASRTQVLKYCVALVSVYIRVQLDAQPDGVRKADTEVERIGDVIGGWLSQNPEVGGPGSRATLAFATGDYSSDNMSVVSIAGYNIEVRGYLQP